VSLRHQHMLPPAAAAVVAVAQAPHSTWCSKMEQVRLCTIAWKGPGGPSRKPWASCQHSRPQAPPYPPAQVNLPTVSTS
jgi:hypothetical protein